jgi:membrane protein DedA with SNARE-associated domain
MSFLTIFGHFPYIGLFLLLIIGGIGFPFPEGGALILCGLLISTKVIKPIYAIAIAYSGVLIGDFLFYSFGRKYGRMIITHRMFRKILSPKRLEILEDKFNKWGILFILIGGRLIGEIFLVAGILKMPRLKFLTIDALSSLMTVVLWIGLGYLGGHALRIIQEDIVRIEHILIFFIASLVIYLFLRHIFWSGKYKNKP